MNKRNESHGRKIMEHLMKYGSITADDAIEKYRCYRLSARIFDLRSVGMEIETEMVYSTDDEGNPMKYAKYKYNKKVS